MRCIQAGKSRFGIRICAWSRTATGFASITGSCACVTMAVTVVGSSCRRYAIKVNQFIQSHQVVAQIAELSN